MTAPSRAGAGLAFALLSATLYGTNIVTARLASFAGVTGVTLVVYRVALMLILVTLAAAMLRRALRIAPGEGGVTLVMGVATAFVGVCYLSSVAFIPVTVAVVTFYTFPALIVLASPWVVGTRLTWPLAGVVALALLGVVLVVGPASEALDPRGIALALAASVATTIQFFAVGRGRHTSLTAKVFWIHAIVLPVSALMGLVVGGLAGPGTLGLAPWAAAATIAGYVFGFLLQLAALARAPAALAGIAYCLEPVVAALTSVVVLGEALTGVQAAGGALVLAAIVTNVLIERRRPKRQPGADILADPIP